MMLNTMVPDALYGDFKVKIEAERKKDKNKTIRWFITQAIQGYVDKKD